MNVGQRNPAYSILVRELGVVRPVDRRNPDGFPSLRLRINHSARPNRFCGCLRRAARFSSSRSKKCVGVPAITDIHQQPLAAQPIRRDVIRPCQPLAYGVFTPPCYLILAFIWVATVPSAQAECARGGTECGSLFLLRLLQMESRAGAPSIFTAAALGRA